jgi:hypothetical protein
MDPKTVKIHSDETEQGHIIINESDFDPSIHQLIGEPLNLSDEERANLPPLGLASADDAMAEGISDPQLQSASDGAPHIEANDAPASSPDVPAESAPTNEPPAAIAEVLAAKSYQEIQALAKQVGVNPFGMSRDVLVETITAAVENGSLTLGAE